MAVALDANATAPALSLTTAVETIDLTTLTVGAGSNRALVVQLDLLQVFSAPTGITVTWDQGGTNQSCTQIVSKAHTTSTAYHTYLYGLVAPTSGNKTLRVSWTNTAQVAVNAVAWTGVDQTGGATTFPNSTSAEGTTVTPSVTISSATDDATMDNVISTDGGALTSPSKTETYTEQNAGTFLTTGGSRAAGAASNVHSWSQGSSDWASVGTSIKASSGGEPPPQDTVTWVGYIG